MADFVFSGGCRWNDLCAVDVKVGADGTPISCKNPITGAEISGGGAETATISLVWGAGITDFMAETPIVTEEEGIVAIGSFKSTDTEITVPLYEGKATIYVDDPATCTVSGDLVLDAENFSITVTGDGTINVVA